MNSDTLTDIESVATGENSELISQLVETVSDLEQRVTDLEAENDDLRDELADERETRSREDAENRQRLHKIEEDDSAPQVEENTRQTDELTPIETLSQSENVSEVTDSPSCERAVSLFRNLSDWGSRTPKGIVLKSDDNPLSLLEAECDETLCWRQLYRAAEALESLSHGSVTFVDSDRHGKMIVLHEQSEAYTRMMNGTLSVSSVEATA